MEVFWIYKNQIIKDHNDLLPECRFFVYCITYTNGKKYLGKKQVRSMRRLKPTKKQLAVRKNYKRIELKNLPFLKYEGSHNEKDLIVQSKEILYQCSSRKASTYLECALLFHYNAIFDDDYLNKNISGKFFDTDLDGLLDDK